METVGVEVEELQAVMVVVTNMMPLQIDLDFRIGSLACRIGKVGGEVCQELEEEGEAGVEGPVQMQMEEELRMVEANEGTSKT